MNTKTESVAAIINKYAIEYPDLTEKDLQKAMATEIVDVLTADELVVGENILHNRVNISMNVTEVD